MIAFNASAQTSTTATPSFPVKILTAAQVPAGIKYKGVFSFGYQWTDALGENYLVGSTGKTVLTVKAKDNKEIEEDAYSKFLFAAHFIKTDTGYRLLWKLEDGVNSCPFDITSAFLKNAVQVTDLNKDGTAETTVAYRVSCRSDVSPSEMKVIMHQGVKKYGLRGMMYVAASEEELKKTPDRKELNLERVKIPYPKDSFDYDKETWGRYTTEKDFTGAPASFLPFAQSLWRRFFNESKMIGQED